MRCKSPLDSFLRRVDKHFLHSYDSYDSTNFTRSPLPTRQARKFLSPLNQMQKSTGQFTQFTLSTRIMSTVLDNPPVIVKYHYLSISHRSIICRSLRRRKIIDLLTTDKSRYFVQPRPIIVNDMPKSVEKK